MILWRILRIYLAVGLLALAAISCASWSVPRYRHSGFSIEGAYGRSTAAGSLADTDTDATGRESDAKGWQVGISIQFENEADKPVAPLKDDQDKEIDE